MLTMNACHPSTLGPDRGCTWSQASRYCKENGGFLAELEDMAELMSVQSLSIYGSMWWLGAAAKGEQGTFKWTSGSIIQRSSRMWGEGKPTNGGGSMKCVHLCFLLKNRLSDHLCDSTMHVHQSIPFNPLCEK
eukprot:TRINITY_DN5184_c0_g1_i1.p1 TRINITY_DN5184_c0_g1~~TRINITY_DN5184_c0_g1_i1.p1  ORF type:complete len:133 (-),score=15.17 TRINITY_DN5184_c0_g1_i1:62-460(-)